MVTRLGIINWKTCARKRPWPNLRHPFRGTEENKPVAGTSKTKQRSCVLRRHDRTYLFIKTNTDYAVSNLYEAAVATVISRPTWLSRYND
jgi:hypothetical protein